MQTNQKKKPTPCVCLMFRRLTAEITKYYDQTLSPCGVTVNQYYVLLNISSARHCSIRELADMAELDRSTVARNLKPLYAMGLVADRKEPGTRNSQLELTAAGKKTVADAKPLWVEAQKVVKRKLGDEGQAALREIVASLEDL